MLLMMFVRQIDGMLFFWRFWEGGGRGNVEVNEGGGMKREGKKGSVRKGEKN